MPFPPAWLRTLFLASRPLAPVGPTIEAHEQFWELFERPELHPLLPFARALPAAERLGLVSAAAEDAREIQSPFGSGPGPIFPYAATRAALDFVSCLGRRLGRAADAGPAEGPPP
jgi:hypothetical protein